MSELSIKHYILGHLHRKFHFFFELGFTFFNTLGCLFWKVIPKWLCWVGSWIFTTTKNLAVGQFAASNSNRKRLPLHLTYFYPSRSRPQGLAVWFCGILYGLAKDCEDLERRSFFYTCSAAEWGTSSPGNRVAFWNISASSGQKELQGHHCKALFFRRTLPQGNDPYTMPFRDIMSSIKTSWTGLQNLQFLQTTYSGQNEIWTVYFLYWKWLTSTRQLVDQRRASLHSIPLP